MEWLFDHLSTLTPASIYYTLGGILLLCGLGLPIPEDISLIAAGYMAHLGVINVHTAFTVCFAAVLAGDSLAFFLGRQFGAKLLETRFFQRVFNAKKQIRVRAYFRKYGSKVIFVGRFLPGLRFSIFFSAGTLRLKPAVFLIYDTLAAVLSVPFLVYLAWAFGEKIDNVARWARRSEYGILVIAVVAAALILFKTYRYRKNRRLKMAAAAAAPTPAPRPLPVRKSSSTPVTPDI